MWYCIDVVGYVNDIKFLKGLMKLKYISTRNKEIKLSSAEVIKKGISDEGGLFVPEQFPRLKKSEFDDLAEKSYSERAKFILKKFLTDFTDEEIDFCVEGAYGSGNFNSDRIAPLIKINESEYILELWHGPTCAFKDMALQILPYFMTTAMKKTGEDKTVVVLVATSGDTGKAALAGFKDVDRTKIIVYYPSDGVSDMQKLQMTTQEGENVYVYGIRGNFDEAQNGVKKIFTDEKIIDELDKRGFVFSSANSINWGRLVPQIVYYVSAYCDMIQGGEIENGGKINICVPTGNFGNILAAYYAKKIGLPVNMFVCASNKNDVLTDFIRSGEYDKNREFYQSISPSMDILISSNLERLLFDVSGQDDKKIKELMAKLSKTGKYKVTKTMHNRIGKQFWAGCCDDYFTKERIMKTFVEDGYTPDTHTAVAIDVYKQYVEQTGDMTKTVIDSTASPFKFGNAVLSALGVDPYGKNDFEQLDLLKEKCDMEIPASLCHLKGRKIRFNKVIDAKDMYDSVKYALGIE